MIVFPFLASGMKYLRQIGIIHRDLKPGNIMRFIDDTGQ
jgi:TANK-binding kinase 1